MLKIPVSIQSLQKEGFIPQYIVTLAIFGFPGSIARVFINYPADSQNQQIASVTETRISIAP